MSQGFSLAFSGSVVKAKSSIQLHMDMSYRCPKCGKLFEKQQSLGGHGSHCKGTWFYSKINRAGSEIAIASMQAAKERSGYHNQYSKAKVLGLSPPKYKKRKSPQNTQKSVWSKERKEAHSKIMKQAVKDHPSSYSSGNRGRTQQIVFGGLTFQGNWELEFFAYCSRIGVVCIKNTKSFDYVWDKSRKYFPDFYLPDHDVYVEVKGYETERDRCKWSQFPKKLVIIKKQELSEIRSDSFDLFALIG